ncbi:hypothetical protein R3P38DRAFT_3352598 [Favolaschia claudopus]|uniref:DUF6534 domain-containing protein n=1 Tax=Favolaschia claudopus TaxID=2862362 RepID=A0AAW0BY76_9AGAR
MSSDLPPTATLGAFLAGCFAAVGLSAVLGFQCFLYFRLFPADSQQYKALVVWIWLLDAAHTALICTGAWDYLILHFGDRDAVENIFPVVALTVALTAVITLSANIFYGWRIHKLSKHNWWLTGPLAFLSIVRVGLAFTTTTEMLISKTFPAFAARFKILFTSGLVVSAVTDIIVSCGRYYFLRNLRQGYTMTHEAVDAVVVFTVNDGCLTCAVVIASIICWLVSPGTFYYLAIYLSIAKLYANSVLATLNLRNWYRHRYIGPRAISMFNRPARANGVALPASQAMDSSGQPTSISNIGPEKMEVFVAHQVEYVQDFPHEEVDGSGSSRKSVTIA